MLFLLKDKQSTGYDVMTQCVVRALEYKEARIIANKSCHDEGEIWTDCERVSCKYLGNNAVYKPCKVILASVNNG